MTKWSSRRIESVEESTTCGEKTDHGVAIGQRWRQGRHTTASYALSTSKWFNSYTVHVLKNSIGFSSDLSCRAQLGLGSARIRRPSSEGFASDRGAASMTHCALYKCTDAQKMSNQHTQALTLRIACLVSVSGRRQGRPQVLDHLLPQPGRLHCSLTLGHLPLFFEQGADVLVPNAIASVFGLALPREPLARCIAVPASCIHASLSATPRQAWQLATHSKRAGRGFRPLTTRQPSHDSIGASSPRHCPHPAQLWRPKPSSHPCRCCNRGFTGESSSPITKATHATDAFSPSAQN